MAAAAYATKFGLLLQSFDPVLSNIENGIAHSTEAAVDLEDSITAFRATGNGGTDIDGEEQQITQLDASIKSYLDMVQELNSQKRILEDMRARLTAGQQLGDGDLVAWFEEKYADEQREWEATDEAARYHGNEEYVEFRRKLWEKRYPNKPFSLTPGENEQEEDDELEIVSQNQSLVCPITQSLLEDPVTSNVCKHSYSGKAITEHIKISERDNHSGRAECPVIGCNKYVKLGDLKRNKSLARLAARKRAQAEEAAEEDEDEYTMMD